MSVPRDSYVLAYFQKQKTELRVGPPVYFVVEDGFNYSINKNQELLCSTAGCSTLSLTGEINYAATQADLSHIAVMANSWLDDYIDWASAGTINCCVVYNNNTQKFCPSSMSKEFIK